MNFSLVNQKISLCVTLIFAVRTRKWFFSSMNPNVDFHVSLASHDFRAKWTPPLLRTKKYWFFLQWIWSQEIKNTSKLFLTIVCISLMIFKIASSITSEVTIRARNGLFTGVSQNMSFNVVWFFRNFLTKWTSP